MRSEVCAKQLKKKIKNCEASKKRRSLGGKGADRVRWDKFKKGGLTIGRKEIKDKSMGESTVAKAELKALLSNLPLIFFPGPGR